jgi:mRNA interferase MazF
MKFGDIILVPFPYAEMTNKKVRPAVVIAETFDQYKDIVLSAISSIIPHELSETEILLKPNETNNLRVDSVIKVDRIVTLKKEDIIANLGKLSLKERVKYKKIFQGLIK